MTMVRALALQFSALNKSNRMNYPTDGMPWEEGDTWSILIFTEKRPSAPLVPRDTTTCDQGEDFQPAEMVLIVGHSGYHSEMIRMDLDGNVREGRVLSGFFGPRWAGDEALRRGRIDSILSLQESGAIAGKHLAYFQDWFSGGRYPLVSE